MREVMSKRVRVIDVADYILNRAGSMSAMKLQKLIYYCQAWSLVWTESPLFSDEIEAWANGPVVRALYDKHRGHFRIGKGFFDGEIDRLSKDQCDVIVKVLDFYGSKDPQWLSNLTHMEAPWKDARRGLQPGERGHSIITKEAILEYYSSL
jgi:uncharacterized phage-associated protein